MKRIVLLAAATVALAGCSTATYVKLPENSVMRIERGEQLPFTEGLVDRTPFSWSAAGGIPYRIEKEGQVVSKGRMRASFRPASLFWPPAGALYWPMGFAYNCYDLTGEGPKECTAATQAQLKEKK